MAGWHHWLNGHESGWTPGVGDGQRGLACCDSWGCKELDMTERLNWTELISSSWIDPLNIIQCSSLSLVIFFILRSILCDMRIATLAFFCFPFAWNIFFHPLAFSLYVSWGLKWVSYRQHMYESCFCIHSASMCLLVGAFNPFTFKVIIDIYVPIAIF